MASTTQGIRVTDLFIHQSLHQEIVLMQAAFRLLLSLPSTSTLPGVAFSTFGSTVPVTNALVSLGN